MIPIAHRGFWWPDRTKQNTPEAVAKAIDLAFGVEVDVWAMPDGGLGVGHDEALRRPISQFSSLADAPLVAYNVKNKNCKDPLLNYLAAIGAFSRSVVFDFELIGEDWDSPIAISRISDREGDKPKRDRHGYWMDCFRDEWRSEVAIHEAVHEQEKEAYIVSPELHGKPVLVKQWREWREAHGICTDFPHLLDGLMNSHVGLYPEKPWWN